MRRRAEARAARTDTRAWAIDRRSRTRHLIELGGLIQKAGLVELTDDDRATLLGGLLSLADQLAADGASIIAETWRRRGLRVFDADNQTA